MSRLTGLTRSSASILSERRQTHQPDVWSKRFALDLRAAEATIRSAGERRVRIDGAFRLATVVFAGAAFADVRGFRVAIPGRGGDGRWIGDITSDGPRHPCTLIEDVVTVGAGPEIAVGLNVSGDLTEAVARHLTAAGVEADRLIVLSVKAPGRDALTDADDVRGWVQAMTGRLRSLAEEGAPRLHLFIYGPRTAATLLGHSWNRMPPTQLSDDLGPGRGYTPAFALASS